jgi:predicted CoA-binding protein
MDRPPSPSGRLLERDADLRALLERTRTIAVLGIKVESQSHQPAYYVPAFMARAGFEVIPVPVYFPEATEILGRRVFRSLREAPQPIDLVNVFRRPEHLAAHVPDIVTARPRAVWLQLGIRHDEVAHTLMREGIDVVQDRCLMVEQRRLAAGPR